MRAVVSLSVTIAAILLLPGCGDGTSNDEGRYDPGDRREAAEARLERLGALAERLRRGGHVLVFRHAATDSAADMTADLSDCSRQRNLSPDGRRQARRIGRAVRRFEVPVGRVLASPFCRTRDTARLAFGRVRLSRALLSVEVAGEGKASGGEGRGLRRLLVARPRPGANAVLVSHESTIDAATDENLDEGELLVVEPGGGERGFTLVETLKPNDLKRLR